MRSGHRVAPVHLSLRGPFAPRRATKQIQRVHRPQISCTKLTETTLADTSVVADAGQVLDGRVFGDGVNERVGGTAQTETAAEDDGAGLDVLYSLICTGEYLAVRCTKRGGGEQPDRKRLGERACAQRVTGGGEEALAEHDRVVNGAVKRRSLFDDKGEGEVDGVRGRKEGEGTNGEGIWEKSRPTLSE